ncbi:hypothetical protein HOD05_03615 [Candidatus Woesearchaeota archaeon]|jgi:hypothetical protein|nr:hypothetical protein [Candidatus Woesearchaeota archaeon]MBT4150640.1 hypothetical protein [Candidatus Woesearchaeota archaeon]MBT4247858.1 hypothetical protein [Candidatus Woesearchaeota archaeon]MBT4434282.1 hypothetical protein [Candidatus Woesearchaeota archaeon]MBT7331889.1 hypothetical protein [Candidatus Woesearchaeota archaeon]
MERPKGVTIFAILEILLGLAGMVGGVLSLFFASVLAGFGSEVSNEIFTVTFGLLGLTLSILSFIAGIGLLRMKKWSRFLVMTIAAFAILINLTNFVVSLALFGLFAILGIVTLVISLIYNIVLLVYFKKEDVHHHFDNQHEEQKAADGEETSQVEIKDQETVHQQ